MQKLLSASVGIKEGMAKICVESSKKKGGVMLPEGMENYSRNYRAGRGPEKHGLDLGLVVMILMGFIAIAMLVLLLFPLRLNLAQHTSDHDTVHICIIENVPMNVYGSIADEDSMT